jgi:hypothetical protein
MMVKPVRVVQQLLTCRHEADQSRPNLLQMVQRLDARVRVLAER